MIPVRVLVVDDSPLCRAVLREILRADGDIEVVGQAGDGVTAKQATEALRPDVVTIDVVMPRMNGLDAITHIMNDRPVPILVVTGQPAGAGSGLAFEAVRRGALELASKPAAGDRDAGAALRAQVRRLAKVKVVRHPAVLRSGGAAALPGSANLAPARRRRARIIAIAASSGGPGALAAVLGRIPPGFGTCVAVVQHLPIGFADSFARYLGQATSHKVVVVREPVLAQPGVILLAADDRHLVALPGGRFGPSEAAPLDGFRPSASLLFRSVAGLYGDTALGVMLTGIGSDGVSGLGELRNAGGRTIAQDEKSCAVYGMPRAAVEAGIVGMVLPLDDIAAVLVAAMRIPATRAPTRGLP